MFIIGTFLVVMYFGPNSAKETESVIKKLNQTAYIKGNFTIGALLPIHGLSNSTTRDNPLQCDAIRSTEGIQLVEAAFYAVDSINNDDKMLPKIKLGIEIRDECWSELVALYHAVKFMGLDSIIGKMLQISGDKPSDTNRTPLLGVIGTASGSNAILIQDLLELLKIPSIGYSTSVLNSRKPRFYLSTVPSAYQEAYMVIQILKKLNLRYFSLAYTDEYYGLGGRFYLNEWAEYFRLCLATIVHLPYEKQDKEHSYAIWKLFKDKRAKVIVCFCDRSNIIDLFAEIKNQNLTGNMMIVGIHDWLKFDFAIDKYEEEARGSVLIGKRGNYVTNFDRYYLKKKLRNNARNPWFEEFWEYRFQCTIHSDRISSKNCTGKEDLSAAYQQGSKVSYVIKSVYAFAHALDEMYNDICNTEPCTSLQPFNSTKYMGYLKNLKFSIFDEYVDFSDNGSPPIAYYDVFNFQKINGTFHNVKIFEYSCDSLNLEKYSSGRWSHFVHLADYQLPGGNATFSSTCSDPCFPGEVKRNHFSNLFTKLEKEESNDDGWCCWSCVPCNPEEITVDNACTPCQLGFWPNDNRTECYKLPITYKQWTRLHFYLAKLLSSFGIILTLFTTVVFLKYRNTPVVKSSTRELCYIILIGVLMQHSTIFLCVAEPTMFTCLLLRIFPELSITMVYGALLVKTNRISRLLAISKRRFPNLNPRFMTLKAQCVVVFTLITVQIILCLINLIVWQTPTLELQIEEERKAALKICYLNFKTDATCLIYNLILVLLCCYYAIKARNVPDNFNEAKFIGFLTYITTLTCIACTLIYYGSQWKMLSVGISMSVNGFNVLIFLFFPKLYIILWAPERNTRENFATATGIRCIIGRKDIISNEKLLRKKFIRKDLLNIEDLYSFRTSTTKESSEETASTIT